MKKVIIIIIFISIAIGVYQYTFFSENKSIDSFIVDKNITTTADIVPIDGNIVKPISYTSVISLNSLDVPKKKESFIAMMLPSILLTERRIKAERDRIEMIFSKVQRTPQDQIFIDTLKASFNVEDETLLPKKLVTHPLSLVLAQAIIESGWGTSRFFLEANNVFGIWSFNKEDNRISAGETRGEKTIYLKKYETLQGSIYDYFKALSTVSYYKKFRVARRKSKDPLELVVHLSHYSELGIVYIQRVKAVIRQNDLQQYDNYQLESKP
jgi:Bax protein